MNLDQIASESFQIAKDHGWWDEPRSIGTILALLHSEVSEALEQWRIYGNSALTDPGNEGYYREVNGKPEGFWSEQADIVIRVCDLVGKHGIRNFDQVVESEWKSGSVQAMICFSDAGGMIVNEHAMITNTLNEVDAIVRSDSKDLTNIAFFWIQLARLTAVVLTFARWNGVDLEDIIIKKMSYNKTRTYRHGNKHA